LKTVRQFLLLLVFLGFTRCSPVILRLYGMKKPKTVSEKTILHYSKKYRIPETDLFILDSNYISFLLSFDSSKFNRHIKNHYQPLQALYYNKNGALESFHVNCYAGGFPNLKWNRNGTFETFPPQQQAQLDSLISLKKQFEYFQPLKNTSVLSGSNTYDFFVVVFWSRFMGRQSKRLLHQVQKNSQLSLQQKVKIIYVNNDNAFSKIE
jgi:hypothetical protein